MDDEQVMNLLTVLQKQQSLQTQAIVAALEGRWVGEGSVEAFLYALNPGFVGKLTPKPPRLQG
jgi:hypothetical protein